MPANADGSSRKRWHHNSVYGTGRRMRLDRERRARFVVLVRADRRHGRLTATGEDVGLELLKLLGHDGRLDPCHATLAARIGCHVATVRRCLNRLRELGRLTWERRLYRDSDGGWRVRQTSNAYALLPGRSNSHPASGTGFLKKTLLSVKGQPNKTAMAAPGLMPPGEALAPPMTREAALAASERRVMAAWNARRSAKGA